eukprot:gnl/TRDRNA2_/TRDRNA2_170706_c2_seq1.p1 gnl/TRDRNA2_/TRDRNA2_170706_c2~~gnl/TRDRNA2_/TRDRNA2_170706_c2_seq1.p1  ORF type:complete len:512 (-),score=97.21 gnl/TRDRNA2_/TRDRNA2_170706_c2_seq1:478-1833(-)
MPSALRPALEPDPSPARGSSRAGSAAPSPQARPVWPSSSPTKVEASPVVAVGAKDVCAKEQAPSSQRIPPLPAQKSPVVSPLMSALEEAKKLQAQLDEARRQREAEAELDEARRAQTEAGEAPSSRRSSDASGPRSSEDGTALSADKSPAFAATLRKPRQDTDSFAAIRQWVRTKTTSCSPAGSPAIEERHPSMDASTPSTSCRTAAERRLSTPVMPKLDLGQPIQRTPRSATRVRRVSAPPPMTSPKKAVGYMIAGSSPENIFNGGVFDYYQDSKAASEDTDSCVASPLDIASVAVAKLLKPDTSACYPSARKSGFALAPSTPRSSDDGRLATSRLQSLKQMSGDVEGISAKICSELDDTTRSLARRLSRMDHSRAETSQPAHQRDDYVGATQGSSASSCASRSSSRSTPVPAEGLMLLPYLLRARAVGAYNPALAWYGGAAGCERAPIF